MVVDRRHVVVLDNGGYRIKAAKWERGQGGGEGEVDHPRIFLNAVAKPPKSQGKTGRRSGGHLLSNDILETPNYSGLFFRRPIDRGYIREWDLQRDIWKYIFSREAGLNVDVKSSCLIVTEPVATPAHMRRAMDELVFEEFGFDSYVAIVPQALVARSYGIQDGIVLDSGFSFTHAVPILNGIAQQHYARRMNIGGKVLTNQLKEVVSFRSWNMMDEFLIVNNVKEKLCYVAQNFLEELEATKKTIAQGNTNVMEYVLPDYVSEKESRFGFARTPVPNSGKEDDATTRPSLVLNNERICIPEGLFRPSDFGNPQGGVHELIAESIHSVPKQLQCRMFSNVMLTGGNCNFPGFSKRLATELRCLTPEEYPLNMSLDEDPETCAVRGGLDLAQSDDLTRMVVSRSEYHEEGHRLTAERFYGRQRMV